MTKYIERLTPEQIAQMDEWAQKWIKIGLSTEPADRKLFEESAKKCYEFAGIPWHNNIVWVDSPIVAAMAGSMADTLLKDGSISDKILKDSILVIARAVDPVVGPDVRMAKNNVFNPVGDSVKSNISDAVRDAVHIAVNAAANDSAYDTIRGDSLLKDGSISYKVFKDVIHDVIHNAASDGVSADVRSAVHAIRADVGDSVHDGVGYAVLDAVHAVRYALPDVVRGAFHKSISNSISNSVSNAVRGAFHESISNVVHVAVGDALRHALRDALRHALRHAVRADVGGAVSGAFRSNSVSNVVHVAVGDALRHAVRDAVNADVSADVSVDVRNSINNSVNAAVGHAVRNSISHSVYKSVDSSVHSSVYVDVRRAAHSSVRDAVSSVYDAVYLSVNDAVRDAVRDAVSADVRNSINDSVGAAVSAPVYASVGHAVRNAIKSNISAPLPEAAQSKRNNLLSIFRRLFHDLKDHIVNSVDDSVRGDIDDGIGGVMDNALQNSIDGVFEQAISDFISNLPSPSADEENPDGRDAFHDLKDLRLSFLHPFVDSLSIDSRESVYQAIRDITEAALQVAIDTHIQFAIDEAIRNAADNDPFDKWHNYIPGQFDGYWFWNSASLSFIREVCNLELEGDLWERSIAFENTVKSACWWYPHQQFIIVSERPTAIHLKPLQDRFVPHCLHNTSGPAIVWPDGWGVYSINGVRIPWEERYIIENPELITVEKIENQRNAEIRRLMIDNYGPSNYIRDSKAQIIEELPSDHPIQGLRTARLLTKEVPDDEPIIYIDLLNSTPEPDGSTKRYMLRVDPEAYNGDTRKYAHAAAASTWRYNDGSLVYKDWRDYVPVAES